MENYSIYYSCTYCGEEISQITKSLQKHPSSKLWKNYGKCCVSCVSEKELTFADNSARKGKKNQNSENYPASTNSDADLDRHIYMKLRGNKTAYTTTWFPDGNVTILCGKIISGLGVISALSFFYTELNLLVFAGLPLILFGIVVCRVGVRRKRRILRSIREYSETKLPGNTY